MKTDQEINFEYWRRMTSSVNARLIELQTQFEKLKEELTSQVRDLTVDVDTRYDGLSKRISQANTKINQLDGLAALIVDGKIDKRKNKQK